MRTVDPIQTEIALQKLVAVYVITGLLFLVMPGTFLGVWNLVSISGQHHSASCRPRGFRPMGTPRSSVG